jgi:hypothetical protein
MGVGVKSHPTRLSGAIVLASGVRATARRGVSGSVVRQLARATCGHLDGVERLDDHARRRPEDTMLYQCVAKHWPEFREQIQEHGGLPRFIHQEFDAYLACGRLEGGVPGAGVSQVRALAAGSVLLQACGSVLRAWAAA